MKEKLEQAGTLPKSLKETPLPPAPATPEPVDPRALKVAALQKSAQGLRSMQGIRGSLDVVSLIHAMMGNPTSLLYPAIRRGLSYGLESPRVMKYLTEPSAEELQMVKSSNVYATKAAAKASTKGNPIPPTPREQGYPATQEKINRGNKPATRVPPKEAGFASVGGYRPSEKVSAMRDRVMKQSMLEETIAHDEEALKNKNLSKSERGLIESHLADFRKMLDEGR
jgi:hypothetical protein